ncbi:hypothetical protein HI914_04550 [Erysiphe necator]|nr:hypothetical protein HI914_04550 [Erysiphe necator]
MVFQKINLRNLTFLSIVGIPFAFASPISTITETETKTVIEVVTVTVFIPLQTSPPFVDIKDQQLQQQAAFNVRNSTGNSQLSQGISKNISGAQNSQVSSKLPDNLTAQDATLNVSLSSNDLEFGVTLDKPPAGKNNTNIEEAPKNVVVPFSNEGLNRQEPVSIASISDDDEEENDDKKASESLKLPPAAPEAPENREPTPVSPKISDKNEAAQGSKIPPAAPEAPEVREPTPVSPKISDENEAAQGSKIPPAAPEVPKAQEPEPIAPEIFDENEAEQGQKIPQVVPEAPLVSDTPNIPNSPITNNILFNQASPVLISPPTTLDIPKSQKTPNSRESGARKDDSPKRVPQDNDDTSKSPTSLSNYESTALKFHNIHRTNHSSSDLAWNSTLAKFALETAKTCIFEHDFTPGDGDYGQNLAVYGSSLGVKSLDKTELLADSITNKWYNSEFRNVPFGVAKPPISGPQFLHLTQVIWKDTSTVGCATYECPRGTIFSFSSLYTVCDYFPAGNVLGQFDTEVIRPLGQSTIQTTAF